jgi:citrate lyase subunit beta-like protein
VPIQQSMLLFVQSQFLIVVAAEDYCADVGLIRTPSRTEMTLARQTVVTAAAAYGLQSIDLVPSQ